MTRRPDPLVRGLRHERDRAAVQMRDLLRPVLVDDMVVRHRQRVRELEVDFLLPRPRLALRGLDTDALPSDADVRARLEAELVADGLLASVARLEDLAPALAAGVDTRNPRRVVRALEIAELRGDGEAIALLATDVGTGWVIALGPDGFSWRRDPAAVGDVTAAAPARDLLLTLYGRRPPAAGEVTGDASLLDRWLASTEL